MLGKHGAFGLLLAGSLGVPYVLSTGAKMPAFSSVPWGEPAAATASGMVDPAQLAPLPPRPAVPLEGRVQHLAEVLRFDLSTSWVLGHWSRVSTGLADLDLQGYRVPLTTGTRESDLAGSLTYYFNPQQRVERITFFGTTGDTRPLVAHLASQHGFTRVITRDPGIYLYRVNHTGKPPSELKIVPTRIVRTDNPLTRFEVSLIMQRPPEANQKRALLW